MQRPVARLLAILIVGLVMGQGRLAQAQSSDQPATPDEEPIPLRRPQGKPQTYVLPPIDPKQVPPPEPLLPRESLPVPDRWRIMESLGLKDQPWNPYVQNTLKGDKPLPLLSSWGPDWFLNLSAISDSLYEARRLPTPVGPQASERPGSNDIFSRGRQGTLSQTFLLSASLIKGDTTFRPPDYEFRFVPAFNGNFSHAQDVRVLNVDPRDGTTRTDGFIGIQEAFADVHLRNVSERFDFDSVRVGIQPFNSDFRGFVFQDDALGVRLFGNRDNNQWQYNLGWFRRIEKDTNSGLNDLGRPLRRDDTYVANLYHQDFPVQGHTTQLTVLHNVNREDNADFFDTNGFLQRPAVMGDARAHHYHVTYVGLNGDGHFGPWNLTSSLYGAFGEDSHNPLAQRAQRISAGFAAMELSRDFDWIRVRATGLAASGDKDPFDGRATGFDAILENPQIAGSDTSFFIRQAIPLIGGGGVSLSGRNGVLPDLRSSKDQGQSNFVNPGLLLFGIGADFDLTPQLRVIANVSSLRFVNTSALQVLRAQANIDRAIGIDVSTALQYRPFQTQNVVLDTSLAGLIPGKGFRQLYDPSQAGRPYSLLFNLILRY
jgi:hypothetical protein